jgi:hypothetical protein
LLLLMRTRLRLLSPLLLLLLLMPLLLLLMLLLVFSCVQHFYLNSSVPTGGRLGRPQAQPLLQCLK